MAYYAPGCSGSYRYQQGRNLSRRSIRGVYRVLGEGSQSHDTLKLSLSAFHATHMLGINRAQAISSLATELVNDFVRGRKFDPVGFKARMKEAFNSESAQSFLGKSLIDNFGKDVKELAEIEEINHKILTLTGHNPAKGEQYQS
jgi:hypothetical protein